MRDTKDTIVIGTIYTGELFDGYQGDDLDLIDQDASEDAWVAMAETAIAEMAAEYDIDVSIEFKAGAGIDRISARSDAGERPWEREREAQELVSDALGEVYIDPGWIRYTREGLAAYLDEGFWAEWRNGVIVSVGDIETDGGRVWRLGFHKGQMPAHDYEVFNTQEAALDRMMEIASAEDWRPTEA